MPNRHSVRFLLFFILVVSALVLVGCSDDEEETGGVTDTGSVGGDGDIFVETSPSELDVPWTMTVPSGGTITGVNNAHLEDRDQGIYSLAWPELRGWNEPRPRTVQQTLGSGSNLMFGATYLPRPGTAMVTVVPKGLDAHWLLESSEGMYEESSGDSTFIDLLPAYYRIIWSDVEGFVTPDTMITQLVPSSPMYLIGEYGVEDNVLLINPIPLALDASWTLTGPEEFSLSGTGQTKVDVLANGSYTITWSDVDDHITPAPETMTIIRAVDKSFNFTAEYMPQTGAIILDATIGGTSMPWSLTNATGGVQSGVGNANISGMRPGQCSVQWLALDGWAPGSVEEKELPVGGEITFAAAFEAAVTVRPLPADLYASWQLSGPAGYTLDGDGEMLVSGLAAGSYTITWNAADGWTAPASSSQTLAADHGLVFEENYSQITETLHVNPLPASLDISWEVTGPLGFSESGAGMASFPLTEAGQYTVVWGEEAGYMRPGPQTLEYAGAGNLNFQADYQETLDLVDITVGSFDMGSPVTEPCRSPLEVQHSVTLTRNFIMKSTEVTNAEFIAMAQWAYDRGYATATAYGINDNLDVSTVELLDLDDGDQEIFFEDGVFRCVRPNHPVKEISWYGAVSYCDWLSLYRGIDRAYDHNTWLCGHPDPSSTYGFRLPTESEWEFACRGENTGAYSNGVHCFSGSVASIAWYSENGNSWSNEVGQLEANDYGLYDMHGNVAEWCNDWYEENYYAYIINHGPEEDPAGPDFGDEKVVRGGYFYSYAGQCRSASRESRGPSNASYNTGFRVVLTSN